MQHYELGKYLRNRYILGHPYKLLNETYLPKEVIIVSSLFMYLYLTSLFPIANYETMATSRLQTNRQLWDDG